MTKLPISESSTYFNRFCFITFLVLSINNRAHSAIRYWVGKGVYNNWSNSANWFTSSGGVGGAMLPSATDRVIFDGVGTGKYQLDDC